MNAFQLLKEDHQKVSGIFQQIEPTTERAEKTRTELFAKLKEELDIHARIEEAIFYPSIKRAAETREVVLEGFEEHHVEEEEGEMFQKARDVLSEEEINQLGAQMEEMKKQLQQQMKKSAANA